MLSSDEVVLRLEHIAREEGRHTFISGRLRVDAEYVGDMGQVYFRVNGVGALRNAVIRAIDEARLNQTMMV
ncbi:hypothetical protein [Paraburkholderia sp. DHOC27]|uniref:hypothetical protein n=1 Tax=Paraburkholderia sp. DHOC27 TaxID=2303330 RepID=UPI0011C0CA8D|nr:hypothetical protein [Paraburkholderia sp. DHOC27]